MILGRIARHLRQQHWTAVLIELVIVVLGIFLGFQVTEWAGQRADRAAEIRHLEEIAEDLRADLQALENIRKLTEMRISGIDYILGETRGVTRPSRLMIPSGGSFDIPAGPPVTPAERPTLLTRVNLVRSASGHRTGFEALLGAGGMQKIRDRQISRQLQVYYVKLDDLEQLTDIIKQSRATGVTLGYGLGLSAFGEMDPEKLLAVVRGSPSYSAYLRTSREWAAIYLGNVEDQRQSAVTLLSEIERYLGKGGAQVQ